MKRERVKWIDLLKTVAIFCVILPHATEAVCPFKMDFFNGVGWGSKLVAFTGMAIGRLGVPIFVMVSGCLLLDREYDEDGCKRFWRRNWAGLLISSEIWVVIFTIFRAWNYNQSFTFMELIENMLWIRRSGMSHDWYLPMILGMYIFLPFVAIVLKKIDRKVLRFPFILAACYIYILPVINVILRANGEETLQRLLYLDFSGCEFGVMFLIGYLYKKGTFKKVKMWIFCLAVMVGVTGTIWCQMFAVHNQNVYNPWYDNGFLVLACWGIFGFCMRLRNIPLYPVVKSAARCSFGIYLIHNLFLTKFNEWLPISNILAKIVILWVFSLAISWAIVYAVGKIPKLGKILFFMK